MITEYMALHLLIAIGIRNVGKGTAELLAGEM